MLDLVDIEAWPVLINGTMQRPVEDITLPLVSHFNHCIAYVPSIDGGLFIDGTAENHGLTELPSMDRGAEIVVRGNVGSRAGLMDLRSPPARPRPGGGADSAAASRSSYDVADPGADATADGGSWRLSGSQDDLLTANWRMRRVWHSAPVSPSLPSLEHAPDAGGDGFDRRRFYMREPSFLLRTRHLGTLRQRPREFYQLTRQGAMYKVERGGCPLCCGDEIFLLTLEERDRFDGEAKTSQRDAKNMMLSVPGDPARALPRHRLRCDSWTECHCDGTTKRFDEEVDVGYVMDGVGPVDVAAHLRTGKAK